MKKINPILRYFYTLVSMFRSNIRDYGMYIALVVICIIFTILTGGVFLGPINFTNLLNQTAYVAVLSVGMTLVIVTRQIDLSVGFLGAYLGSYVVVAVENNNSPVWWALVSGLIITIVVGAIKGFAIAKIKVPSFVVTLAGMFIFKGLLMLQTSNRTIPTSNAFFNSIGIGYFYTWKIGGIDMISLILGLVLILGIVGGSLFSRHKKKLLGIPNERLEIFTTKLVFMAAIIFFLTYSLATYKGLSYLLLITIVVVAVYFFLTTQTVLGRRIYAVGGNPEAAELSGISVEKIIVFVFISMGILSLISGVMYVSRTQNTSPNHGPFWELYAIAAAYIGGTSANGGFGKIVNAVIGSIVIMSLKNGMALAGVDANIEPIVLGSVLLLAVVFDIYTRNVRGIDLVGIHYAKTQFRNNLIKAKAEHLKAKADLMAARKENIANLLEYEYRYTNATGELSKIKETIRAAKEEDYLVLLN
jgi:putative multiple sugar transport system permease protein